MTARASARLLLALAVGAAGAVLALWGATGSALRSDWLLGEVNSDPDSLFVSFTGPRASPLPGRIRFETLTFRSRDSNVEWEARLEDATVDVALASLAGRRFHAKTVRAAALVFRLRERLTRDEATPARLARYPPIAGFKDPPLRDPPAPRPPPGNPWRLVVDDLFVGLVREIWIDSWRWNGAGSVAGGMFLRSGIEAQVLPSEIAILSGTLHWGDAVVSRRTSGHVRAALPRFDVNAFHGNEVWKIMSGSASLAGTLDAVPFLAPDGGGPRILEGGAGTVRARVALEDGRGRARLDAQGAPVVVRIGDRLLRGAIQAGVFGRRIDFPAGTVDFGGTRARLRNVVLEGGSAAPWSGTFEVKEALLRLAGGSLDASVAARIGDARPLVAFLPPGPPKWVGGLLDLRDFEAAGRVRASTGALKLSPVHAEAGTFSIDADWRRSGGRRWGALLVKKGALSLGLGLRNGATSLHLVGAAAWYAGEGEPGGLRTDQPRDSAGSERPRK